MTNPSDPRVLTQVKQYRFVRELGSGGMGAVYEAVDSRDGGRVAVKLLHPWLAAEDVTFRDRFEREAHIAALLRSPYSVRLLDFGVADANGAPGTFGRDHHVLDHAVEDAASQLLWRGQH